MGEEAGVFTHQSSPLIGRAPLWGVTLQACHVWAKHAVVESPIRWRNTGHQPHRGFLSPITVLPLPPLLLTEHLLYARLLLRAFPEGSQLNSLLMAITDLFLQVRELRHRKGHPCTESVRELRFRPSHVAAKCSAGIYHVLGPG